MTVEDAEELGKRLSTLVSGQSFGALQVLGVIYRLDLDSEDEPALFLDLILSDPKGETWDLDDVRQLRRVVIENSADTPFRGSVILNFAPATDLPQEEDDPS